MLTNTKWLTVCTLILASVFFAQLFAQGPPPVAAINDQIGYKIGDKATDFKLKNIDGSKVSLSDFKDAKGYIVIFTSNVCPFAVMYEDRIIELHNKMNALGYPVIAINSNDPEAAEGDSFDNMVIRAKEKSFPYVYIQDKGQKIYPQYGATKTPHVYLLDKNRIVQYIGAIDDNARAPEEVTIKYVENAVAALESGNKPNPSTTKAIGCPIKTKGQGGKGKGKGKGERRGPPNPEQLMERMDKNSDSKISLAEAEGPLKNDFERLDTDKDGFLTSKELANIAKKH